MYSFGRRTALLWGGRIQKELCQHVTRSLHSNSTFAQIRSCPARSRPSSQVSLACRRPSQARGGGPRCAWSRGVDARVLRGAQQEHSERGPRSTPRRPSSFSTLAQKPSAELVRAHTHHRACLPSCLDPWPPTQAIKRPPRAHHASQGASARAAPITRKAALGRNPP